LEKQAKEFWECCNKNNINITVSSYPVKLNRDLINHLADEYHVKIAYRGGDVTRRWSKFVLDIEGKQNYKQNFYLCPFSNNCIFLENGKLATCGLPFYIRHFNQYFKKNMTPGENDYCDIYKAKTIKEILRFLSKPIPFCRYCNIKSSNIYEAEWGNSKKIIEEWT